MANFMLSDLVHTHASAQATPNYAVKTIIIIHLYIFLKSAQ